MSGKLVNLDTRRGLTAQRDTENRRQQVIASTIGQNTIHIDEEELEKFLQAAPASTLLEAAAKAKYLLQIFSATAEASAPHRQALIASTLDEIDQYFD